MADLPVPPWLWALLGAWVLGSIPVGYVLVKARTGADVRAGGSGTVGARNVARVLGWRGFVATLLGDLLKGLGAVLLAQQVGPQELWVAVAALLACVVGHDFPPWIGWRGGNGIAPLLGGLAGLDLEVLTGMGVVFALALLARQAWAWRRNLPLKAHLAGVVALLAVPALAVWRGWSVAPLGLLVATVGLILATLWKAARFHVRGGG